MPFQFFFALLVDTASKVINSPPRRGNKMTADAEHCPLVGTLLAGVPILSKTHVED